MNQHTPTLPTFTELPAHITQQDGKLYRTNAKGHLVPCETISAVDALMDDTVRKIMGFAIPLADQVARFRRHSFADVNGFLGLIMQNYNVKHGGKKGNFTLMSFDGLLKVKVANADQIMFGPELHAAKALIDDCLREWSADTGPELRTIVTSAFQVDKEGKLNHAALFALFKHDFENVGWKRAMEALKDSIRVVGNKTYMRFYKRQSTDHSWTHITIDMANA